jgi:hypothetical protein
LTTLQAILKHLEDLKADIIADDKQYEYSVKERRMMDIIKQSKNGAGEDLIMFSKGRKQREVEEE